MRPSIPDWLEQLGQKLTDDDPNLTTLELTHQRIDDVQARFLAEALRENTKVTVLILSCFAICDDGAIALSTVLANNSNIKKLQLRDLRNSREVILFCQGLARNTTIKEFSLRHSQIDGQSAKFLHDLIKSHPCFREIRIIDTQLIGESVVQTCKALQFNKSLNTLYLINAEFDAVCGAETLRDMLKSNVDLRDLHVCESNLEGTGITILSEGLLENSTLQHLNLRSNAIGIEGALSLANLVKTGTSLIGLNLAMNNVGSAGAEALAQGLRSGVLRQLNLSDNGITAEGGRALAEMLRKNTSIHELNLSFNSIGDAGAASIANILEVNTTLKRLFLRRCNITNKGAYAFAWKLPRMRGLKELVMTKNSVNHKGAEAFLQGLRFNMELEYLHVEDKVSAQIQREIVYWIRLNRAGRRIFRNTRLQSTLWPRVLSRVNHDMDVLFHFLSEKPDVFHHAEQCRISTL